MNTFSSLISISIGLKKGSDSCSFLPPLGPLEREKKEHTVHISFSGRCYFFVCLWIGFSNISCWQNREKVASFLH